MVHLIDKDALVAEIERRLEAIANASSENNRELAAIQGAQQYELINLIQFINTLETKEVDLEKEIELIKGDYEQVDVAWNNDFDFIAHHFYELGQLNARKEE